MIKATGGKGKVAILLGASGNNVTTDRTKGFKDRDQGRRRPGIKIVFQQTGEFAREKGQQVTEQLIQSKPGHQRRLRGERRDGPRRGHRAQGRGQEGRADVKIVSIDGTRNAVQASSTAGSTAVIESNPRFGPLAFQTLDEVPRAARRSPDKVIITRPRLRRRQRQGSPCRQRRTDDGGCRCSQVERRSSSASPASSPSTGVDLGAARRRGARAGRRERRRQVHADQGAHRRVPPRRRRGAPTRGEPVELRRPARRPARRDLHRSTRRSTSSR